MIRPLPEQYGYGFMSMEKLDFGPAKDPIGYREEKVGRYWNYHFTNEAWTWPYDTKYKKDLIIDGFSPNLNKHLHIGHLRQLALANALKCCIHPDNKFVAMLGASLGVYGWAEKALNDWFSFLDYKPKIYYDVLLPMELVECRLNDENDTQVFDGPKGEVIVRRSDGRPTYAFNDLAFAKHVGPTHYITGVEQKEHFESLGLGDKHLPMGLVLGADGKKMKSRDGTGLSAEDAMSEMMAFLRGCNRPRELAWNIFAWNFLRVGRSKNVNYDPSEWSKPDSPGLYITYTHARIKSALGKFNPTNPFKYIDEMDDEDWKLFWFSTYHSYYLQRTLDELDPSHIANFAHDLARKLGNAYHREKIKDGRDGFKFAIWVANDWLRICMNYLGMFVLDQV